MMSPCWAAEASSSMFFSASDQVWPTALQLQDLSKAWRYLNAFGDCGIGLAVDRHGLLHVFARIAVGEQRRVRGGAECLAGALVVARSGSASWR